MFADRKWMWIRLAVWVIILAYLVTMLRNPELSDAVSGAAADTMGLRPAPGPVWTPLLRPPEVPAVQADQAGDATAVLGVLGGLDRACGLTGVSLRVRVDAGGLAEAATLGPAPTCAAATVWKAGWPAVAAPLELEMTLP